MLFTQVEFFFLLGAALVLTCTLRGPMQKLSIVACSFVFYGWWDWRYLGLLLVSTTVDFLAGLLIESARRNGDDVVAKLGLTVAVSSNIAILAIFKYFDFFSRTVANTMGAVGITIEPALLHVVLPMGISFYTFHAISYAVDVYRGDVQASRQYLDYLNFVAFFPQLVAGPIARASHLLPQVTKGFSVRLLHIYSGSQLFLFGLIKKLVIADNMGPIVDRIFAAPEPRFLEVLIGGTAFMVQIYCDFSGYTDMARGTARMFGITLLDNFRFPYLVANPREFWRNWHISLSTWLRDYLFIPLGGSHGSFSFVARNLIVTMMLGGLWHGANWNFVFWGAFHGVWLVVHRAYSNKNIGFKIAARLGDRAYGVLAWCCFSGTLLLSWIIFRCSQSSEQLARMLGALLEPSRTNFVSPYDKFAVLVALLVVLLTQLWQRRYGEEPWRRWPFLPRMAWYTAALFAIAWLQPPFRNPFIYFQF